MRLNPNEKKVLEILIENAKVTDSAISKKLKISSQAIGKIRKKLEKNTINSYEVELNPSKIGITVFAISKSKLTQEGLDKGQLEIEEKIKNIPNALSIYRLPSSSATHIINYGFRDIEEMDSFFHSQKNQKEIFKYLENIELFTFSHNSLIKDDKKDFYKLCLKNQEKKEGISEIEKFKKKISK
jgi:DNA-binding Lrp family transcriptional regulator